MVVSSPVPFPTSSSTSAVGTDMLEPNPAPSPEPSPETVPASNPEPNPAPGSNYNLNSRGMGKFPPRLSREPRPKNGPHAHINLPQLPGRSNTTTSSNIPPLSTTIAAEEQDEEVLTLEMRPARLHVSSLWHRLRFSGFSPMASQRRSTWKPGKPRRGRPEGTKGAGSRSL